jgi:hypothetical protein
MEGMRGGMCALVFCFLGMVCFDYHGENKNKNEDEDDTEEAVSGCTVSDHVGQCPYSCLLFLMRKGRGRGRRRTE